MPHIPIHHISYTLLQEAIKFAEATHATHTTCDMTHIPMSMSHVTHTNESRLIDQEEIIAHNDSGHTHGSFMSHIWMSHVTHMNESCHTYG